MASYNDFYRSLEASLKRNKLIKIKREKSQNSFKNTERN